MQKQLDVYIRPEVHQDSVHLRNLKVIFSLLRYPEDHWIDEKELLRQRVDENMAQLPSCMIERYLPSDYQESIKLIKKSSNHGSLSIRGPF